MPIDFSPLDPRSNPEDWERLVARVLRDARTPEGDAPDDEPADGPVHRGTKSRP